MSNIYKVRHIPTGYFIQPSNSSNCNSNIGKRGKVYEGNNIWKRIESRNEYRCIEVYEGYGIFDELAKKFPNNVEMSTYRHRPVVRFYTKFEDFEQVFL